MGCCDNKELERKIWELTGIVYNPGYKTILSGLTKFIPQGTHKLNFIRGKFVYKTITGEEVKVKMKIFPDKSIEISSNLEMSPLTLILF